MTYVLTGEDVDALLDHPSLVEAIATAHRRLSTGRAVQPAPTSLRLEDDSPLAPAAIPMTALDRDSGLCVVKTLVDAPDNRLNGLPAQRSTVALFDAGTAACVAIVDGREITRLRTAAATVMATRALAADAATIGVVGGGALAVEHVIAHAAVLDTKRAVAWSRSSETRRRLAAALEHIVDVVLVSTPKEVFEQAATVCTLTPADEAFVDGAWLQAGTHVNAVGSPPRRHFRELRPAVLHRADLVTVDSLPVALAESGNVNEAITDGFDPGQLVEIGDVLTGTSSGRTSPTEITVFNSVGIGLQDLAATQLLVERARALGIGEEIHLRGSAVI